VTDIVPIGTFYEPDKEGFITNILSLYDIDEDNWVICNYILNRAVSFYGNHLHSVYVRGSLLPDADKDFVIVLLNDSEYSSFIEKYEDFLFTIDSTLDFDISLYNPQNLPIYRKFESICLYGNDLSTRKVVFKEYAGLPLPNTKILIDQIKESTELNKDILSSCKVILRAAMHSVAQKVNKYSKDLYYCCKFYEEYYPHRGQYMWDVLDLYLNPTENYKLVLYKAIQCLLEGE
jgi:uncharacterized protein